MEPDPFATLGIAPTLDVAVIKRAYFAALKLHPPHADVEGFGRVRTAYEALMDNERRAGLVLKAGFDAKAAFARLHARYGAALAVPLASVDAPDPTHLNRADAFVRTYARLPLGDAVARAKR